MNYSTADDDNTDTNKVLCKIVRQEKKYPKST